MSPPVPMTVTHKAPPSQVQSTVTAPPAPTQTLPKICVLPPQAVQTVQNLPVFVYLTPEGPVTVPHHVISAGQMVTPRPILPKVETEDGVTSVPASTLRYRKRKYQELLAGETRRRYTKHTNIVRCKLCGCERDPKTHKQYFGNWYCPVKATVPFEEWRAQLVSKGYGKKKK